MRVRWPLLPCSLIILLLLSGCWDSAEFKQSAIVMAMGMDKAEGGRYRFVVEILKPSPGNETSGIIGAQRTVMELEEDSPIEAVRKLILYTKRRLYITHCRIFVIGEKLAKENVLALFDSPMRDQMFRMKSFPFVTRDNPADILKSQGIFSNIAAIELATSVEQTRFTSIMSAMPFINFLKELSGPIRTSYLPVIQIQRQDGKKLAKLNGVAVFNDLKLAGYLNIFETNGLLWLRNQIRGGVVSIRMDSGSRHADMELQKTQTKVTPVLEGEQLTVHVKVKFSGTIAQLPTDAPLNAKTMDELKKAAEQSVKENILLTLKKLQKDYKTDITNVGIITYRKYPRQWKEIKDHYHEVFAKAKFDVEVTGNVNHPGLIDQTRGAVDRKPPDLGNFFRFMK